MQSDKELNDLLDFSAVSITMNMWGGGRGGGRRLIGAF